MTYTSLCKLFKLKNPQSMLIDYNSMYYGQWVYIFRFFSTEGISMKYTERQGPQNKNFRRRSFPAKEEYFWQRIPFIFPRTL